MSAARLVFGIRKRANGTEVGDRFSGTNLLAEPNTLFASWTTALSFRAMPRLDPLPVRAVIVIVVDVPVFRRLFLRIRVIWSALGHSYPFL